MHEACSSTVFLQSDEGGWSSSPHNGCSCKRTSSRPVLLHSSATSLPRAASSAKALLDADSFGSDHCFSLHNSDQSDRASSLSKSLDQEVEAGRSTNQNHQAAAYNLLCNPREAMQRKSVQACSSMECVPEDEVKEKELCHSNMQSLILKAKGLQV